MTDPVDVIGTTDRLVLRRWRPDLDSDVEAAYLTYSCPEVARWLGASPVVMADRDEARERLERYVSRCTGYFGVWAVCPRNGPDEPELSVLQPPMGSALFVELPRSDGEPSTAVEIGWHLHPAYWGRGKATETGHWLIRRAREAGHTEVHAVVYPDNVRSLAVCDRLGMTRRGVTEEWYGVSVVDHTLSLR